MQGVIDQTRNMFDDIEFRSQVAPEIGDMAFTGNDILRVADGRFVEYWTGTSAG